MRQKVTIITLLVMAMVLSSCELFKLPIIGTLSYTDIHTTRGTVSSAKPNWSSITQSNQHVIYSISPLVDNVSIDSNSGIITVSSNAKIMDTSFTIRATGTDNYKGSRNASIRVSVKNATITNIVHYILWYGNSSLTALRGTTNSYRILSNTIPDAANASYALSARGETDSVPTGIKIDNSTGTITVEGSVAVGRYELRVTATPMAKGYTGTKVVDISISVAQSISTFTFEYDTKVPAVYSVSKSYTILQNTIPKEANASYALSTRGPNAFKDIKIDNSTGTITVEGSVAVGRYELRVTATPMAKGYTGTKTADISITILEKAINISNNTLVYDISAVAIFGEQTSYTTSTNTIPDAANASYALSARGATTSVPTGIKIDNSTGKITVDRTVAVGRYELRVTATARADGYTGEAAVDITIVVSEYNISNNTLAYDTSAVAIFGEQTIYNATITIPAAAKASYALSKRGPNASKGIKIDNSTAEITVEGSVAVGTYKLSVTATVTANGYTGTKVVDISISVAQSISTFTFEYDTKVPAVYSISESYTTLTNTIPAVAKASYALSTIETTAFVPTGIKIDNSTAEITVEGSVAAGTYKLRVTATARADGYTGETAVDITIVVSEYNISNNTLAYEISAVAIFGEQTIYNASTTIPKEANASYALSTRGPNAFKDIKIDNSTGTITVDRTVAVGRYELRVTATARANGYTGTKTADISISVAQSISTFTLAYDTSAVAIFGEQTIYNASTTIPKEANASYALSTRGPNAFKDIKIDNSTGKITVDRTVAVGRYELRVTATPTANGYTGTKIADISISVNEYDISGNTLVYDISAVAIFGEQTIYNASTTIPKEANASYALSTRGPNAFKDIKIDNSTGMITVDRTVAVGRYELRVTATPTANGYTGTKIVDISIIVAKSISGYGLSYNTKTPATFSISESYNATITIPQEANASYALSTIETTASVPNGIKIDNSTAEITVEGSVAAGKYKLRVTATARADGYTGETAVDITIVVSEYNISNNTLAYTTTEAAIFGTQTSYITSTNTIPAAAKASYVLSAIGATTTVPRDIDINIATAEITVEGSVAVGTYKLRVTATATANGYTGETAVDISITVALLNKAILMPAAISSNSISLVWAAPSNLGKKADGTDASVSSYMVYYQRGSTLDYSKATTLKPSNNVTSINGTEVVIPQLSMGTQYSVGVRTSNNAGGISTSNTVTLATKKYTKLGANGAALINQDGTWSYNNSNKDNGTEQAGTNWSCVEDKTTGLVWEVKTNKATADARDKALTYKWGGLTALGRADTTNRQGSYNDDWNALVLHANDMKFTDVSTDGDATESNPDNNTVLCGFSDWRVPTLQELSTLIDYTIVDPAYNTALFPNGESNSYWSSSPYAGNDTEAWRKNFKTGRYYKSSRINAKHFVRLVRGVGASIPNNWGDGRYSNNNDGTITDNATNLIWKQCSEGYSGNDCNTNATTTMFSYEEAKQRVREANSEVGFTNKGNWRVPTIEELETIVALDNNKNINTTIFPNTQESSYYWSSSPYAGNDTEAWSMHFNDGEQSNSTRTAKHFVRLVLDK